MSGEHIDQLSQSLIARALHSGRPVLVSELPSEGSADSIVLCEPRSALCAPIYREGEAVACPYVTHSRVTGLFGPTEIQLTEFIATLAGAALEHLAGTEARFWSLAQNSSDVITVVGREGTLAYQSSAVTRVFGFTPTDLVGSRVADWAHPGSAPNGRPPRTGGTAGGTAEAARVSPAPSRRFLARRRDRGDQPAPRSERLRAGAQQP